MVKSIEGHTAARSSNGVRCHRRRLMLLAGHSEHLPSSEVPDSIREYMHLTLFAKQIFKISTMPRRGNKISFI